jgi:predicted Zn-dependent protease
VALGPTTADLARAARQALGVLRTAPGVEEGEVFVAANAQLLARLAYTSHIPSNGVEEPKSTAGHGLGIRAVFAGPDGPLVGFGAEPSDLSPAGVGRALAKARAAAVRDPAFVSLPRPGPERRTLGRYHDPRLLDLDDGALVGAGWATLAGALRAFEGSARLAGLVGTEARLRDLGLIVGGDVSVLLERVAIASTAMPEVQTDESTVISASVTAMIEAMGAKGSGWSTGTRLGALGDQAGGAAAEAAVRAVGGQRVPSGRYPVILGPQPVADLLGNLVLPGLHASAFHAASTPFLGRLDRPVAASTLSLHDDGARPGLSGSKGITCEGLPTGRTELVTDGVLRGLLANWYEAQRLLRDPRARDKLGVEPAAAGRALAPRNGFRFAAGGGRSFAAPPGIAATNVVVECRDAAPLEELLRRVDHGLYVGRIWYTYPINGLRAGDFTCTVVGDSHVIRGGRLEAPIRANTLRISDNIRAVLEGVLGATPEVTGTLTWGADEVVYAPCLAVAGLEVEEIAGFVDRL